MARHPLWPAGHLPHKGREHVRQASRLQSDVSVLERNPTTARSWTLER
ncbi:unnamed protein product [Ciceribacter selenitireducens ATCC BAA-1503]|uniref:Uncharacterized protein n=1 Tax=Ciceribacter selenitireducens ATCC BAA-1503 TaxID=1336235 RepID=A0A376AIL1_9HYPH|nr:unnamed protein product [Ciceribacter selenitireducens ATCC BAA-1503]